MDWRRRKSTAAATAGAATVMRNNGAGDDEWSFVFATRTTSTSSLPWARWFAASTNAGRAEVQAPPWRPGTRARTVPLFTASAQREILAQGGVQRPVGHQKVISHARGQRAIAQIGEVGIHFFPILLLRLIRGDLELLFGLYVNQDRRTMQRWTYILRVENAE